ncbi:MAG: hypothetical protein QN144_14110 [Armatimonadota bacterium]|nr:hypothetical protein [Armatimonadota bacterium]
MRANTLGQRGAALVMVLLMLLIFLAVGAFVMLAVDRNTEMRVAYQKSTAGFHAAEAAVNQAAGGVRNTFLSFNVPSDEDCREKFLWINEREVRYRLSVPGRVPGDCRPPDPLPQVTLPTGNPFEGLNAIVYTYNLRAEARHQGNTEAIVNMQFEAYLIPMFQFAGFYGQDLELTVGPPMVINGRLHSNADMYLNTHACDPGLRILGQLTIRGELYRGRKDHNSNFGVIRISLDGSPTNLRVFGAADPDDARCLSNPGVARRPVGPEEVALYRGRINEDAEAIALPAPGLNCAPWSCPQGTQPQDMVYWNNADIRIVLDARPGQEKRLDPRVGPALWPVVVVDRNGNVDQTKTEAIRRLMIERPGVITYTDVPLSRWNCRVAGECEDVLNAMAASVQGVDTSQDTLTLSSADYAALQDGDAVRVAGAGTPPGGLAKGAFYYVRKLPEGNRIQLLSDRGGAPVDITSQGSGERQLVFSRSYADPANYRVTFPDNPSRLSQYGCPGDVPRGPRDLINGVPSGQQGSNYCNDYRYGGFFNHRERKPLLVLNVDWMALEEWNQQNGKALWDPDDRSQGGLVVFLSVRGPNSAGANNYAVRVYDAQRLTLSPTNSGVTFASDVAMYVAGNFNCADPDERVQESTDPMPCGPGDQRDRTIGKRPSSLVADTINVLSCAWVSQDWEGENPEAATTDDPWNGTGPCRRGFSWTFERMPKQGQTWGDDRCPGQGETGSVRCPYRLRDERSTTRRDRRTDRPVNDSGQPSKRTVVNAAFLAGNDPTWCPQNPSGLDCNASAGGDWYGGGLENYPRFHECWAACNDPDGATQFNGRFWYEGSLVSLAPPGHTCFSHIVNGIANDSDFPCSTSNTPYPGFWKAQRYSPPQRRWFYDVSFNDARNLPPLSPRFLFLVQNFFTEESR